MRRGICAPVLVSCAALILSACATPHDLIARGRARAACEEISAYYAEHGRSLPLSAAEVPRLAAQMVGATRGSARFRVLPYGDEGPMFRGMRDWALIVRVDVELETESFVPDVRMVLDSTAHGWKAAQFSGVYTGDIVGECSSPSSPGTGSWLGVVRLLGEGLFGVMRLTTMGTTAFLDKVTQPAAVAVGLPFFLTRPKLPHAAAAEPTSAWRVDPTPSRPVRPPFEPPPSCVRGRRDAEWLAKHANGSVTLGVLPAERWAAKAPMGAVSYVVVEIIARDAGDDRVWLELTYGNGLPSIWVNVPLRPGSTLAQSLDGQVVSFARSEWAIASYDGRKPKWMPPPS